MNTRIEYLYRDAENDKTRNVCVVRGEISKEQEDRIWKSCKGGFDQFIPSQVDLPEIRPVFSPSVDVPWMELVSFEFTEKLPTVDLDVTTLTESFVRRGKLGWDPKGWMEDNCPNYHQEDENAGAEPVNDYRFIQRKSFVISFEAFEQAMKEVLEAPAVILEKYPVLSCYSAEEDRTYDEDEILKVLSEHLGITLIAAFKPIDQEVIYFIADK